MTNRIILIEIKHELNELNELWKKKRNKSKSTSYQRSD